jgi:hypothetical protein
MASSRFRLLAIVLKDLTDCHTPLSLPQKTSLRDIGAHPSAHFRAGWWTDPRRQDVTPVTLKDFLPTDLDIAGLSVNQYLARLAAEACTIITAKEYGRIIYDLAIRRQVIKISEEAIKRASCRSIDDDPLQQINDVTANLQRVASSNGKDADSSDLNERDAGDDVQLPLPRQWLLGNQFCRKFLSGVVAPGSTGKSALRIAQSLSLATGRPLTDQHVFKRCRVLLVSLEDDVEEMKRRILAARIHYAITLDDLKGWLFYASPKGVKLAEMRDGSRQIGVLEKSLRAAIERRRPDLVILDPYVKLHALEENDNGAMDFVCDLLATLAFTAVISPGSHRQGQSRFVSPG